MDQIDSTIARLYRAAAGNTEWRDALTQLVGDQAAHSAHLIGVNRANGAITFSHCALRVLSGGIEEANEAEGRAHEQQYMHRYFAQDPRIPCLTSRRVGEWFYDQDEFTSDVIEQAPYYRDFLVPNGAKHTASVRLFGDEAESVILSVATMTDKPRFLNAQLDYFKRIAPHLIEAIALFRDAPRIARGNAVDVELMERIGKPVVLLDSNRRITAMNAQGEKFLSSSRVLANRNGRLSAIQSNDELALTDALVAAQPARKNSAQRQRVIIRLQRADARIFAASLVMLSPTSTFNTVGPLPQFMLTIHRASAKVAPDIGLWQAAYDLTKAEVRVAAEVFEGTAMPSAAEKLGISYHTANSHLDHIFTKTNTRRQAQLMKALMSVMP